jgi:hypothetical protein
LADKIDNDLLREEMVRLSRELHPYNHTRSLVVEEGIALRALGNAIQVCNDTGEYRQYVCHVGITLLQPSNVMRRTQLYRVLRCVFGNLLSPVAFDPNWLTSDVAAMARGMYETRDFAAMPILADAL